jgi:glycosyltransferase involved in cell wall biosynthesis
MVGDGPEKSNLEAKCTELNLTTAVRFVGFQTKENIPTIRMMADVNLCLMAGFSLIEACASGRPVVAYDVDWHSELIKDGETGRLVPVGQVEAVAEAICDLLDNPEKSASMGQKARELAFERHAIENTDQMKIRAYEELQK